MLDACQAATYSPDPSTQNGAVLLDRDLNYITSSCNEFPTGVLYSSERWERPAKYKYIEHAERNAYYQANRIGVSTVNSVLVCPWAACADCARAIVQAGTRLLVRLPNNDVATHERWKEQCEVGDIILDEAGVTIYEYPEDIGEIPNLRRDGKLWVP